MPLGTMVGLGLGNIVLDADAAPPQKGSTAPNFRPMSIVAKRSPISATAERLYIRLWEQVIGLYLAAIAKQIDLQVQ